VAVASPAHFTSDERRNARGTRAAPTTTRNTSAPTCCATSRRAAVTSPLTWSSSASAPSDACAARAWN